MDQPESPIFVFDRTTRRQKDYWLRDLNSAFTYAALPTKTGSSILATKIEPRMKQYRYTFDPNVAADIFKLTGESALLLYTLLATAMSICLRKYTHSDTLLFGSPAKDAPYQTALLPIVTTLSPTNTFKQTLLNMRDKLVTCYDHQAFILEKGLNKIGLTENHDWYQHLALTVACHALHHGDAQPTLSSNVHIDIQKDDRDLRLGFQYDDRVYHDETIRMFCRHLSHLLSQSLSDPDIPLSAIRLLSKKEEVDILALGTGARIPSNGLVHQRFEDRVQATPHRMAVVAGEESLTYDQLNKQANSIARHLSLNGVNRGDVVALYMPRSTSLVASILGVLKAGAAYLPIDQSLPEERIRTMLADANVTVVLRLGSPTPDFPLRFNVNRGCGPNVSVKTIDIKQVTETDEPFKATNLRPFDLAYVLYTSGTTGQPKAVAVEHHSVVNLINGLHHEVYQPYGAQLKFALFSPVHFDASVPQLFSALLLGHQLFIAQDKVRYDGFEIANFIETQRIDVSDGTPTLLRMLTTADKTNASAQPVLYMIGGERLPVKTVSDFYNQVNRQKTTVVNVYGPTECCGESAFYKVSNDDLCEPHTDVDNASAPSVPIGYPLPNQRLLTLDCDLALSDIGMMGDIYIGGEGVSRGYMNDTDRTETLFIQDPYHPCETLYKTGDLGCLDHDGRFLCFGRVDTQIKINGLRIDTEEIEHCLNQFCLEEIKPALHRDLIKTNDERCQRCLLSTSYPNTHLDANGICTHCHAFDRYQHSANAYFKNMDDFSELMHTAKSGANKASKYDCLLLFSGGKDSSYVLYQLVELGYRVLAYTFDNGFISQGAFDNIARITDHLQVDRIISGSERMHDIFVESLRQDDTVCNGCFKSLTTISTEIAREHGINVVLTGLSRGQIFETKLAGLFSQGITETTEVEHQLKLFREIYHHNNDKISRLLNIEVSTTTLNNIHFVDFFRYDATPTPAILRYLQHRDAYWLKPEDTGFCSSNCMINDVGIVMHTTQTGYHNYEAPLSWDIRLGVADRHVLLAELELVADVKPINTILQTIGYFSARITDSVVVTHINANGDPILCAYYVSNQTIPKEQIFNHLKNHLPSYMIPVHLTEVDRIPLSGNGKRDISALPNPQLYQTAIIKPRNELEEKLYALWTEVLQRDEISIYDNFFDVGGNSLLMTRVRGELLDRFQKDFSVVKLLQYPSIATLAKLIADDNPDEHVDQPPHPQESSTEAMRQRGRRRAQAGQRRNVLRQHMKQDA